MSAKSALFTFEKKKDWRLEDAVDAEADFESDQEEPNLDVTDANDVQACQS
jgi:hypothetical protein